MPVIGGLNGVVTLGASDLADVGTWSATLTSNNREYGSSDTAGHTNTVKGRKAGTISFEVKNNTDDAIWDRIKIGDQVTLLAKEDATRTWTFPCRIESMDITVPIEDAEVETVAVESQLHGAFTYPDGTVSS